MPSRHIRFLLILILFATAPTLRAADPTPPAAASKPTLPPMPPPAQAPVRTFSLGEGHGDLVLRAPTTWDYAVEYPPVPNLPPTIAFSTGNGRRFSMQVTPLWPPPGKPDALPTPDKLKAGIDARRKNMLPGAKETTVDLLELKGEHAVGYYFTVTDKQPKPGEFECMTSAAVRTGDLLLSVTILHHAKDTPERTAALEGLKSAEHRAPAKDAKDASPPVLRIASPVPASGDLLLPAGKLRIATYTYTAARRTTEVMAMDEASGLTVSVWMEPAVKPGGDATAVRALYWGRGQQSPIPKQDVKLAKVGDYATVEYMVPDVAQKNLNVYAAKSGLWVDVHVSKVDYTDKDQPLFTTTSAIKFDTPK